jgi:hypothetical protein
MYQEFGARTRLFTRPSAVDPTNQEVVARARWLVQLWLVDADCDFYDSAPTNIPYRPTSVHVPPATSVSLLRQFSSDATAMLHDLTDARPSIRTKLNMKTHDGRQHISD